MKKRLIALVCLIPFSSSVYAAIQCPDPHLIEQNIDTFVNHTENRDDFSEKEITLNGRTWVVESDLMNTDIKVGETKGLNKEISNIDEHTCNYLIYPTDSNLEDVSIMLTATSK
ncbi:MAG: hypothetical protein H0X26_04495 [Alphaproteobacteria bacterium]|nr:hypothetical protein [Alphaproteobacteria bacterium]